MEQLLAASPENLPATHEGHVEAPELDAWPATQAEQPLAPAEEYRPPAQETHSKAELAPVAAAYLPGVQFVHVGEPETAE